MKRILISFFLLLTLSGCVENPTYTNGALYNCQRGTYSFPAGEQVFKEVELFVIDYDGLKENKCSLRLDYKVKVKPDSDNPYYEIDFDLCTLTVSQLAYFKEKNADLMTMLKDASCDFGTVPLLERAVTPLDFKGQVREILSEFGTTTTEFTGSYDDWVNDRISYEDFQEATKKEKRIASKAFKDLNDLQPQPENVELQTKAVKAVELYLDSLNSLEDALSKQSQPDFEASMKKSTAQMGEATTEVLDVIALLEEK